MHHLDPAGFNVSGAVTCILPMAQTVYTGDEDGRVVSPLLRKSKNIVDLLIADVDLSTSGIAFNAMMDARIWAGIREV